MSHSGQKEPAFIPYRAQSFSVEESMARAVDFHAYMEERRTVRDFSDRMVPEELMQELILTASTAPSGAHKQPWTFCLVGDPDLKRQIREAAEKEEYESYNNRMSDEWLEALAPLGTDWNKPFLERAPWLVVIFKKAYDLVDGEKKKNYYVNESVGLAAGFFLAAVHQSGLVSLTHTPSPMNFLTELLGRPDNERPFLLVPVGYPEEGTKVPDLKRKSLGEVMVRY